MSHQYTEDEVREMFIHHVRDLIRYWAHPERAQSIPDRLSGLAFSILSTLDGSSCELPGFIVAPCPHPDDKAYHQNEGTDWFPENDDSKIECDIAGCLHELLYRDWTP